MPSKLLFILYFSLAIKIVEYRLAYNYGQVFHDFSDNSRDGVNGISSTTTTADTTPTDRGAWFPGGWGYTSSNFQITLPSNDQQSAAFTLPSTFTIAAWFISYQSTGGLVFYRYRDSNNYFYLSHTTTNNVMTARIVMGGNDSTDVNGPSNSFYFRKLYLDAWELISLVMSGNSMKCYQNNILQLTINLPGGATSYIETGTYVFYIGGATAVGGIMWNFAISDDSSFQSCLISACTTYNCLTPACKNSSGGSLTSYSPATVDPYLGTGYMSEVLSLQNSQGSSCPSSTISCYGSISLICACNNGSCYFDTATNSNMCLCPAGLTTTSTSCCTTGYHQVVSVCCEDSCNTCSGGTAVCLTCIAGNASPDAAGGCTCNSGFYGLRPLLTAQACIECYSACATCNQTSVCLTCVALNSSPHATEGCNCDYGYYGTRPLTETNSCTACNSACTSCNQSDICSTCIANNSYPETGVGCRCNQGYYGGTPLNASDSCVLCHSECYTCVQALLCTSCIAENASPDRLQGCACNRGYYGYAPLINSASCDLCLNYNPFCYICNNSNPDICLECIAPYKLQGSACVECSLGQYFNATTETCDQCSVLCQSCMSLTNCNECSVHSSFNSQGYCECNTGYSGTSSCIKNTLVALLAVDSNNNLTLHFNYDLSNTLQATDFSLTINTIAQVYQLDFIDAQTYLITIQFQANPNEGDKALIVFLITIVSTDGTLLSTNSVSVNLFAVTSQYSQAELDQIHTYSTIGMAVGISMSLGSSFMSMDMSTFFNFINGAEIFTYAVVYDIDLDTEEAVFLNGLRISPKIPSIFDKFLKAEDGIRLSTLYSNFGYPTSLFMLNQGNLISVIMFVIMTIPLFHIIGHIKNKYLHICLSKLKSFRYSFVFRLWIQSCLDVTMSAFVGIINNNQANLTQIIDCIICYIIIVITIQAIQALLFTSMIYLIIKRSSISPDDTNGLRKFLIKYGTFFVEFKGEDFRQWQYYPMFILRRFIIVLIVFCVPSPALQLSISVTITLAVMCMQTFFYLLSTGAYANTYTGFTVIVYEFLVFIFYILLFTPYIFDMHLYKMKMSRKTINLVFFAIVLNAGLNLLPTAKAIAEYICKKIRPHKDIVLEIKIHPPQ